MSLIAFITMQPKELSVIWSRKWAFGLCKTSQFMAQIHTHSSQQFLIRARLWLSKMTCIKETTKISKHDRQNLSSDSARREKFSGISIQKKLSINLSRRLMCWATWYASLIRPEVKKIQMIKLIGCTIRMQWRRKSSKKLCNSKWIRN